MRLEGMDLDLISWGKCIIYCVVSGIRAESTTHFLTRLSSIRKSSGQGVVLLLNAIMRLDTIGF